MKKICKITGNEFEVSDLEMTLRKKMGIEGEPDVFPAFRFMWLAAFNVFWNLHKRKCDKTGQSMISLYGEDCPYPVWHKDEWVKGTNPLGADFDENQDIFPQMWAFFQKSPIPHNIVIDSENCEYTDNWWHGKNCYLCHSGLECEDVSYSYRMIKCKDVQFGVFADNTEVSADICNVKNCFETKHIVNSRNCNNSAFLYDCRNCHDCMFCWNLRNKQYCFENEQLTKDEYEQKKSEWNLSSHKIYQQAEKAFLELFKKRAWHRASLVDFCENCTGNYIDHSKNIYNGYFVSDGAQDCVNVVYSGVTSRDLLDCVGTGVQDELIYCSSLCQDGCYSVRFSYNLTQCRYLDYSAHCLQCEHCFGCCGLVGKKYHIFNKEYSSEEYKVLREKIIAKMKQTGEWGQFFPGYFSAVSYAESWSAYYWPLDLATQKQFGFRVREEEIKRENNFLDRSEIPDNSAEASDDLAQKIFWDEIAHKPFQIQKADIVFAQKLGVPLPDSQYARRLQELFRYMPFDGTMRTITCAKCGTTCQTSWPSEYDDRILCEKCYLESLD